MSAQELSPGLMVIHGNQPELLRQLLVQWFKEHPLDPLEDEVILVQSNGIAQWLKLALATDAGAAATGGSGIAAAMNILLPSRFVWQAYRGVLGRDAVPDTSPFDKPLLKWRLMRMLPELAGRSGYEPLARFLEHDGELRKRYQLAEKIADLFDQYQVYRADWLDAWARGKDGGDVLLDANGNASSLDAAHWWQPMLWRALLADVGGAAQTSRAAVHQRFLATADTLNERPSRFPRRISVFGLSSLPRQPLEALVALSRFSQVILCVHNPCEHYWADLISERDLSRRTSGRHARKAGTPEKMSQEDLHLHGHPLLAAWGRQGRDYIALVDEVDHPETYRSRFDRIGQRIDLFVTHGETSLLNQLQEDIRLLRPTAESRAKWPRVDPAKDRSIRFHIAHSPQREVEILHDQLLAAFNADPTLRHRDIIVMVPDIKEYAPHIEAVFGLIDRSDDRHIPFTIADQGKRHQVPLAFALERLLQLPESRLAVSDLLDLLDVPALRERFGIGEADLPQIHQWISQTNIRWGLNADHRRQFIGGHYEQNTWAFGIKRMLLGYAVGTDPTEREDHAWHDIEPYGEVSGLNAALVGPLARLLSCLETLNETLATAATPEEWSRRLQALLSDFFGNSLPEDSYLLIQLQSALGAWLEACQAGGLVEPIPLAVVREHWLTQIDQSNLTQRFLAGKLTFATLMPMRAIPFRMICLLGMSDGAYPRSRSPVDFDLMAKDVRTGDRSRREDDRYLFLEALLSARERLHISWVGRSIQDNSDRPPSVLVSQLRDHIAACWQLAEHRTETDLLAALTVEHRLQPFSSEYFGQDPDASPLFTFAREWQRAPTTPKAEGAPGGPLAPPVFDNPISLGQLVAFLKDPVRTFFRERLHVDYDMDDVTSEDNEPFSLDGLEQWTAQDALIKARLDALLRQESEEDAVTRQLARIRRRGELPIGKTADLVEDALKAPLDRMFELYAESTARWPHVLEDVDFQHSQTICGQVVRVQGRITQRRQGGGDGCRIELSSSNLLEEKRYRRDKLIGAWVQHLASHVDGTPITTIVIGKNGKAQINPLTAEDAKRYFGTLVEAYVEGLCAPLPLAARTGFAWLEKSGTACAGALADCHQPAVAAARAKYEDGYDRKGEASSNPYLQRIYPDFERLWSDGRFTEWCDRLLAPLMRAVGESVANEKE